LGCEVWRDLDWLCNADKVVMDVSGCEPLASDLLRAFDSQVAGGKRYDLGAAGRRRAHATYHESHAVDGADALVFGMDLSPLLTDDTLTPGQLCGRYLRSFESEVQGRLKQLGGA
jgi:hypothetical protein